MMHIKILEKQIDIIIIEEYLKNIYRVRKTYLLPLKYCIWFEQFSAVYQVDFQTFLTPPEIVSSLDQTNTYIHKENTLTK